MKSAEGCYRLKVIDFIAVTQKLSLNPKFHQSTQFFSPNLQERKAWIKPELREIEFKTTANGGFHNSDGGLSS